MAYITKRGNSYSVRYTYEDEHGKSCDKWESFPTKEEATNRKKQIEHELAAGTLQFQPMQRIPTKTPTVQKPCRNRVLTPGQTKNHFIRQRLDGIGLGGHSLIFSTCCITSRLESI